MALRQVYSAQHDIPDALREHYVEQNGEWRLTTDPPQEDVSGLKTALASERDLRRKAEVGLNDMKVKFEGVDPEEFRKLQDRVKGLDDAEIYDRQGIEALVARRTETMKTEHERVLNVKDREINTLKASNTDLTQRWKNDRIETALTGAITKSGVAAQAITDAVQRGKAVFNDLDDHGNVVARDRNDTTGMAVRYGKDGITPLSPEEWIGGLKASGEASHLWPASSGGGAPAHHGANGAALDALNRLPPAERLTRARELGLA